MTGSRTKSSRRAFFLSGSAVLGAGVATTVGAVAGAPAKPESTEEHLKQLQARLSGLEDREAIRQLHLAFTSLVESQRYEAAAELFDERAHLDLSGLSATGKRDIAQAFADQYRQQNAAAIHNAYRQSTSQQKDSVAVSDDHKQASATFHVEVEVCTPLQGNCTAAEMARLQGNVAARYWEIGRFDAKYVKTRGQWKVASLSYLAS